MEDVVEPHGTTPDFIANEHGIASAIRYQGMKNVKEGSRAKNEKNYNNNDQETLVTVLQKKRESAAAHKANIMSEEQQASPRILEEPIGLVNVTTVHVKL